MTNTYSNLNELSEAFLFEITKAMSFPKAENIRPLARLILGKATRHFSEIVLRFDSEVAQNGSAAGVNWLLPYFVAEHQASGTEVIPKQGPLLIVSNHPASYDGLIISVYINRPDYKIIIGEIPPYHHLPHLSQHIIFSPPVENTFGRIQTVGKAIQHLKNGGAMLIFPRGNIEPDPAFMPNPDAEFHLWSRSLEIFLRSVPQTRVLVTAVSGVISQQAFRHPITWFRRSRPDKQRLAFMHQMIRQVLSGKELFGLTPRVTFGEVLTSLSYQHILTEIEQSARRTMVKHLSYLSNNAFINR